MQIEKNPLWRIGKHPLLWGCLLLAAVTILNNWPMAAFGFAWDDYGYVVRNYPIQDPVSLKSLLWCLTAFAEANWHPTTWLALHLQFQLFGLNPGGYHVTNLLLHIANTLLLYALHYRTTRAVGKSLFVAALFSVHPLHIESVAWISEIKDVLSTFFFLLMLHAYVTYSRRPGLWRYGLVGLLLALGLASKPMLVTAPFVMLLLDYWPLGRWTGGPEAVLPDAVGPRYLARRLILEKLPFLAMVAAACVLTFLAQRDGGAVASLSHTPMMVRLGNVTNSYVMYVWRMIWPWPLSFFYPYEAIPAWRFGACLTGLAVVSAWLWRLRGPKPYLLIGWLWYLGTLVPVIGLVQVGAQAMADRYTYIPSIGLLLASAWLLDDLRKRVKISLLLPTAMTAAVTILFMCVSLDYLLKWSSEEDLYTYGISVNGENTVALLNHSLLTLQSNQTQAAIEQLNKVLKITPGSFLARANLAAIYLQTNNQSQAFDDILAASKLNPKHEMVYKILGKIFQSFHDYDFAARIYQEGLAHTKADSSITLDLTMTLIKQHRYEEALSLCDEYLPHVPDKNPVKAFLLLYKAVAYRHLNDPEKAKEHLIAAMALQKLFPHVHRELAALALADNMPALAEKELVSSLREYPFDPAAISMLAQIYASEGKYRKAYQLYRRAATFPTSVLDENDAIDMRLGYAAVLRRFGQTNAADMQSALAQDLRFSTTPRPATIYRERLFPTTTHRSAN